MINDVLQWVCENDYIFKRKVWTNNIEKCLR